MFAGFNLQGVTEESFGEFYEYGENYLRAQRRFVQKNLEEYICENARIDGTSMQNDWFPSINADVFLSHAHKDERLIVALAGWLHKKCNVHAFVDSYIWGFSNNLLEILDRKYCIKKDYDDHTTYSYEKRNNSTSHVHMMLSTALNKMIDRCECLFFVNTPNSIDVADTMKIGATLSPWIYSELALSQIVRHKKLAEYRRGTVSFSQDSVNESAELNIQYNIALDHLYGLSVDDLQLWAKALHNTPTVFPLDKLYEQRGIIPSKSL